MRNSKNLCKRYRLEYIFPLVCKIFQKNIDKKNLCLIILNSYKEYENECKSNNHDITNRLKNNRIWHTLINTCRNPKNDMKTIRGATNVFIHSININLKNYNIN